MAGFTCLNQSDPSHQPRWPVAPSSGRAPQAPEARPFSEECYIVLNGKYYKLHKTLYGLKQSAYEWNSELHKEFIRLGLRQSKGDPCVYVRDDHRGKLRICTWVDDIVGAATSKSLYDEFMQEFKYPFSSSGSVDYMPQLILGPGSHSISD